MDDAGTDNSLSGRVGGQYARARCQSEETEDDLDPRLAVSSAMKALQAVPVRVLLPYKNHHSGTRPEYIQVLELYERQLLTEDTGFRMQESLSLWNQ